jgi:hypothetical protein
MNILEALHDPSLFRPHFRGPSWTAWRVFLAALFALPVTSLKPSRLPRGARSGLVRHLRKRLLSSAGAAANPASWP